MALEIPHNALILVADGAKALLLRNTGRNGEITLREESRLSPDFGAQGPSGARPEDQSPKETGEATFAKQIAQTLQAMKLQNGFEALVVVADPQTLGQLREAMHKAVESSVVKSLDKDLTGHTPEEIAAALR
ncbi:host attachment family protein [Roseomonas gilardii subsp. gilardii]|uniref:baeRF12 domain-containing protein n=1 Tax=Roseomonas gilardii TaxID=257708 RepID=UPI001FFB24C4|nr:host attachment family protein [Roseomonas gilardii]UPG72362.1 host attachment family protein [Roseomonas gilardii subsp. gilardii]